MNFNLGFETSLDSDFVAGLTVTMRSEKGRSLFEIPVRAPGFSVVEIPDELNFQSIPLLLSLRAAFRNLPQVVAEAAVRLPLGGFLSGMRIHSQMRTSSRRSSIIRSGSGRRFWTNAPSSAQAPGRTVRPQRLHRLQGHPGSCPHLLLSVYD